MTDHAKWANRQVAAAIALGVNPLDAANAASAFLALLPADADPDTYIVPAYALEQDVSDPALVQDAVNAFAGDDEVPSRFKLILLAGEG